MWTAKQIEKHERKNQIDKLIVELAEAVRENNYVLQKYDQDQVGPDTEAGDEFMNAYQRCDEVSMSLTKIKANTIRNWNKAHSINEILGCSTHPVNPVLDMKKDLAAAAEILKHIEEQSRQSVTVVVGAPLREAVCNCLNSILKKVELSK
jgi:hypothetical protein